MQYPSTISIKDITQTHAEYDCDRMQKISDFYAGGQEFEKRKSKYLRLRAMETQPGPAGAAFRSARLACAYYTPHMAGIIDQMLGASLQSPLTISVQGTDPRAEYWRGLNSNCDGDGRNLNSLAWSLLVSLALHRRAYVAVTFDRPDEDTEGETNLARAKTTGMVDAEFCALSAAEVDDWERDEDGDYLWVRTHTVSCPRNGFGPAENEVHCWTYATATEIAEYEAIKKVGKSWDENTGARLVSVTQHGLGVVPIFPVEVEQGFWIGDRLISTAEAYFNRESSREFALDTGALNVPIIKTEEKVSSVMLSELGCIRLPGQNDDFFFRSPDAAVYAALQSGCDYLLGNLYSALHAMALRAASSDNNARQSGVAKSQDKGPMQSLLLLFTAPVIDAMQAAVNAVVELRNEADLAPTVGGLDKFDAQAIELEINRTAAFLMLPGIPATARKIALNRLIDVYLPSLTSEELASIENELDNPPEVMPSGDPAQIRNEKTNEPASFGAAQTRMSFTK